MIENICYQLGSILLDAFLLTHDQFKGSIIYVLFHFLAELFPALSCLIMLGLFASNELSQGLKHNLSQSHCFLRIHNDLNAGVNQSHDVALLELSYLLAALISLYIIGAYVGLLEQYLHFLLRNLHNIKYNFINELAYV